MEITLTSGDIIALAEIIGAVIAVFGIIFAVYKWYLKQNKQDTDIAALKEEMTLLTYGVLSCLKGLSEKGCNGPVTEAINKIEKHINQQAHR